MISNTLPLSLTDNPILSQWIAFEPGKVRIATGKVEIGQGIVTAMTQIAAEELDVRPDQIRIVSGETDVSPAEYFTSGSYSVAVGGAAIRLVCAEVRSMLLDKAADALRCPVGELSVEEGQFLRGGKATGRDYWSMAPNIDLDRRASGTAPTKSPSKYTIVGKSLPRLDLPAKVKGAGFIHDIAVDGVLHARVLRQPWRGAQLAALDEAAVRKAADALMKFELPFMPGRWACGGLQISICQSVGLFCASSTAVSSIAIAVEIGAPRNSSSRAHCTRTVRPGCLVAM